MFSIALPDILHTFLLGPVKYFARKAVQDATVEGKRIIYARCSALNWDCVKPRQKPTSLVKHVKSWVGRDFKSFVQVCPFLFLGAADDILIEIFVSLSLLAKLLYGMRVLASQLDLYAEAILESVRVLLAFVKEYEKPTERYLSINTTNETVEESTKKVLEYAKNSRRG